MIDVEIPGRDRLHLEHLVLDVNGTIAVDGQPIAGVKPRLESLKRSLIVHLVTADTHGRQAELNTFFGLSATIIAPGRQQEQKTALVRALGADAVCFVGNGAIDAGALRQAALGIAVVGEEGVALEAIQSADIVAPSITAALDMLLRPARLTATLRR